MTKVYGTYIVNSNFHSAYLANLATVYNVNPTTYSNLPTHSHRPSLTRLYIATEKKGEREVSLPVNDFCKLTNSCRAPVFIHSLSLQHEHLVLFPT